MSVSCLVVNRSDGMYAEFPILNPSTSFFMASACLCSLYGTGMLKVDGLTVCCVKYVMYKIFASNIVMSAYKNSLNWSNDMLFLIF